MALPSLNGLDEIKDESEVRKLPLEEYFEECQSTEDYYFDDWVTTGWVGMINLDLVLSYAIELGASDIHISARQPIAYTILGDIRKQTMFAEPDHIVMEDLVKGVLTNEASALYQRDLEYDTSYEIRFGPYIGRRFRVSVGRSFDSNFLVFRTINDKIPSLEELNVEEEIISWFDNSAGAILVCGPTGSGKALHKDTLVITPEGYKRVHEIEIGDVLFDKDGNETRVLNIHQAQKDDLFYKLTLNNGEEIKASGKHDWLISNNKGIYVKIDTNSIKESFNEFEFKIPRNKALKYYKGLTIKQREQIVRDYEQGLYEDLGLIKEVACSLDYYVEYNEKLYISKKIKSSHRIVEIVEIEDLYEDYFCFEVDSPSHSYLISESMIPTHNSTTMSSILRDIQLKEHKKIITIEKPIEAIYPNDGKSMIIQRAVPEDSKTFDNGLTGAMRQNPDYILIGEVRNQVEVNEFLRAAETGHLAMSTIHTVNNVTTLNRIRSLFSGDEQKRILATLGDTLRGIVNQALVKTKDGKGRFAVREILTIDYRIRRLVAEDRFNEIREIQESNWSTMEQKLALAYYVEDKCTYEEARSKAPDQIYFDEVLEELKKSNG